ncbi:MAG: ABC transporter ATP-binding protein, partial [Oscillospiraceae bacterium]
MLELRNIKKTYKIGDIETKALDGIDVAFREKEFVAILGTSGSGKTTCLNVIGGLDRYDSGEMIINGKKTMDFKERDWDAYRNNSVGFVFQSYNLIMHLSIVANVELGMTLSGVSTEEKRKRALQVLEQVGLKDHLHKKPNQLSGGQMQRVAIARALANDPEILLCDEPTGALDTTTSVQIMDLIKEVAKDRLVIMVTHNPELAESYTDRIIRFQDGKIVSDSHPHEERPKPDSFHLKKTSMSFLTALQLSYNNIRTKKGRTFLTAFASSIGIIGIAVILSLSTGFKDQIDTFQSNALSEFPIIISQKAAEFDLETLNQQAEEMRDEITGTGEVVTSDEVFLFDPADTTVMHTNLFTDDYIQYLNAINPDICNSIGYTRIVSMNMVRDIDGKIVPVSIAQPEKDRSQMADMSAMTSMGVSSYPVQLQENAEPFLQKNYDLLSGQYPTGATDLVLVVNSKNRLDLNILKNMGFETNDVDSIKFSDIVGTEFKIISNNNYYVKTEFGSYLPGTDYKSMFNSPDAITVRISGIVRQKTDVSIGLLADGVAYSDELSQMVIDKATDSDIVKAQKESNINVITMEKINEATKTSFLSYLGGNATPFMFTVYPNNFNDKDAVVAYLDGYNDGKEIKDKIIYTDLADTMSTMTGGIMDGVTLVLIA